MTSRRSIHSLAVALVATAATFFAVAGGAHAATFCVASASCSGTPENDVPAALAAAAMTTSPDRVEIGPGTYQAAAGFAYTGGGANNSVDIVGAGAGQTTLEGDGTMNFVPALLVQGGAPSTVSDLTIKASAPADPTFHSFGLIIAGKAERVDVQAGDRVYGVQLENHSTLSDSHVSVAGTLPGVQPDLVSEASVVGSVIEAPKADGAQAYGGSELSLSRSRIDAYSGVVASQGGSLLIDDSLVLASTIGLDAYDSQGKVANLQATNVTVVGTNPTFTGADSGAATAGGSTNITLQNSVIANAGHSLLRASNGGDASLFVDRSAYDHSNETDFGPGSIGQSQGNIDVTAPGFVDPGAGDYHLRADSPLVDRGTATPFGALGATDLDGHARALDGDGNGTPTPDIGAFEYQPPAPSASGPGTGGGGASAAVPPAPAAPAITAASLTNKKFAVGTARTATAARAKRGTAFKLSLSQAARVKIDIRRKSAGGRKAGALTRWARQGSNRIAFSGRIGRRALKPGRYVAVITATDPSGKHSSPRTLSFTVLKG